MATITQPPPTPAQADVDRPKIGPADHGKRVSFADFTEAEFEEGHLYELARGVVVVTEVPGPNHGRIVDRIEEMLIVYRLAHPGVINYRAGGADCRLRLPGMQSDRHPDQAVYLDPEPKGKRPWTRWIPHIVIEIVSEGGEERDFVEKREEYLRAGVREHWILDPSTRTLYALQRAGDTWQQTPVLPGATYHTDFLPGLDVRPDDLFGPPETA
jgi:Uma2 family endonuclease